jgi:hypothetical protein
MRMRHRRSKGGHANPVPPQLGAGPPAKPGHGWAEDNRGSGAGAISYCMAGPAGRPPTATTPTPRAVAPAGDP